MNDTLRLFQGFGVELEYMIVDAQGLDVRPIADKVLHDVAGKYVSDVEDGPITWSNELVLHVIELKTTVPAPTLSGLPDDFQASVRRITELLAARGCRLMPTAMHPWMDPHAEMVLWPHDSSEFYETFHRIFDCRGHGWANLQSVHLNLPFADDHEFARLHAAIRLVLPILPALAASSPLRDGRLTGLMDSRLDVYRTNSQRVPSVAGLVIPEPVFSAASYQRDILDRIYADMAPHDPEGILRHEWLNARGAIARFVRNSIEIRVLDVQECPRADVAICAAITAVLRLLTAEQWAPLTAQQMVPTEQLHSLLLATIRDAERAILADPAYLGLFGYPGHSCQASDLWRYLLDMASQADASFGPQWMTTLGMILDHGPLARRIVNRLGDDPAPPRLRQLYGELCDCLLEGKMFTAAE